MSLKTIRLNPQLESALASGHPWIYRNHLPKHTLHNGEWTRLEAGKASAIGLYDAESAIAVRLFPSLTMPDRAWVQRKVKEALELRNIIAHNDTNPTDAYRLIYGEGDGFPGIVADRYGRFVVIKTYSSSVDELLEDVVWALGKELKLKGIAWRKERRLEPLWGELPPPEVTISENSLKFIANLYEGQKTGLFLDQRENRQTVRGLSQEKTVLNLFSYNGGFSIYALAGGAKHVTSVDIAAAANKDAERNTGLNGFLKSQHDTVTADVFTLLDTYVQAGKTFDMVIVDPPSLAKDKTSRHTALRAYKKLNLQAMKCVKPGGLLVSSSCTSQVSEPDFKKTLAEAATEAKVIAQVIHEAGHALDHPVPLHFPEGRYLKFVIMRVLQV
jgi:23S rRNA (cytosine1962-C5)-methyltransferase